MNKKDMKTLFSSESNEWSTPRAKNPESAKLIWNTRVK